MLVQTARFLHVGAGYYSEPLLCDSRIVRDTSGRSVAIPSARINADSQICPTLSSGVRRETLALEFLFYCLSSAYLRQTAHVQKSYLRGATSE